MKNTLLWSLFVILVVAGASGTFYFYSQYKTTQSKYQAAKFSLDNPKVVAEAEVKEITEKLGKLMVLPVGEEPTVATVLDKDKVKDQQFFANAENGDKVVIYSKAMKAILYRLSENKIIEVAPISISQTESKNEAVKPTPTEKKAEPTGE